MTTYQFQSNSQLLMLYFNKLLPTSSAIRLFTFASSCGNVCSRFPFKNNVFNLVNFGKSSVGMLVSMFPLKYSSSNFQ